MFRICFMDRDDVIEDVIETDTPTLDDAENVALFLCRIKLSSGKIMLNYRDDLTYDVLDGLDVAGQVEIKSI
jgi:hypothetical protein